MRIVAFSARLARAGPALAMHLPDGFLSAPVAVGYGLLSAAAVALACRRLRAADERGAGAVLGVSAAFIFAAQMVNFPVAAGTSGHLVGGALAAALLGLPAAVVVMSSVLFVQCFVFGDGGVFALGANVFNMALVGCSVGYCVYRLLCGNAPGPTRRVASVAFASWCATVVASASCAEQLALSGTARLSLVLPAMLGVHALIGLGEAVITALVVATVLRFRPELLENPGARAPSSAPRAALGLAMTVAVLLTPLACSAPDGLSRVAGTFGFQARAQPSAVALVAQYRVPGLGSGILPTLAAAGLGTLLLFGLCWVLAVLLVPRPRPEPAARVAVESSG